MCRNHANFIFTSFLETKYFLASVWYLDLFLRLGNLLWLDNGQYPSFKYKLLIVFLPFNSLIATYLFFFLNLCVVVVLFS